MGWSVRTDNATRAHRVAKKFEAALKEYRMLPTGVRNVIAGRLNLAFLKDVTLRRERMLRQQNNATLATIPLHRQAPHKLVKMRSSTGSNSSSDTTTLSSAGSNARYNSGSDNNIRSHNNNSNLAEVTLLVNRLTRTLLQALDDRKKALLTLSRQYSTHVDPHHPNTLHFDSPHFEAAYIHQSNKYPHGAVRITHKPTGQYATLTRTPQSILVYTSHFRPDLLLAVQQAIGPTARVVRTLVKVRRSSAY